MKSYFLLLLGLFFLSSCDDIQDALDNIENEVDITTNFVIDIPVAIPDQNDPEISTVFTEYGGFDLLSSPEIAEKVGTPEQIKKVTINSIQYEYENFSGNVDAIVDSEFRFRDINNDPADFSTPPTNVANADLVGDLFTLNGDFSSVSEKITEEKVIIIIYRGNCSHNPAIFNTRVYINATVTLELDI